MGKESGMLHPLVADWLHEQGVEWYHEVAVGGTKKRVDFMAWGNGVTWLIECKLSLQPAKDIPQIYRYYTLHGDPRARVMIAVKHKYKPQKVLCQYRDAGIVLLHIDMSNAWDNPRSIYWNYPEHRASFMRFTEDQIEDICISYRRHKTTFAMLAEKHHVSANHIQLVLRVRGIIR